jgi:hypothetical protein
MKFRHLNIDINETYSIIKNRSILIYMTAVHVFTILQEKDITMTTAIMMEEVVACCKFCVKNCFKVADR